MWRTALNLSRTTLGGSAINASEPAATGVVLYPAILEDGTITVPPVITSRIGPIRLDAGCPRYMGAD